MAAFACLMLIAANAQHPKYWVGGSGAWSDGSHWSLTSDGAGGANAPRANEDVIINALGEVNIVIDADAELKNLSVDATRGALTVTGGTHDAMRIHGDWRMHGSIIWALAGEVLLDMRNGAAEIDTRGIVINSDVVFDGSGAWSVLTDLTLGDANTIILREGTLITNTNMVRAGALRFEGRHEKEFIAGSSVITLSRGFEPNGATGIVRSGRSHLLVSGAEIPWGDAAIADREEDRNITVCGTGPGQTPFTINAQLVSNYNGFGVTCSGACDATVTVTITGGTGPLFPVSWSGGPNTPTWTSTCVGNKLVIVTDAGQGIGCAATVQVTGPAPLGTIFFPAITPPTCAQVCNGTANALAVGGTGSGYTYNWNNTGAGPSSFYGQLCAGSNSLQIKDQNLCSFDTVFTISLQPISPNLVVANSECNGACDGTATVTPTGGTGTYTYEWSMEFLPRPQCARFLCPPQYGQHFS